MNDSPHLDFSLENRTLSQVCANRLQRCPDMAGMRSQETQEHVAAFPVPGCCLLQGLKESRHPGADVGIAQGQKLLHPIKGSLYVSIAPLTIEALDQAGEFRPLTVKIGPIDPWLRTRELRELMSKIENDGPPGTHKSIVVEQGNQKLTQQNPRCNGPVGPDQQIERHVHR